MCSVSPRQYNPINLQAGRPLRLPLQERPGFSVDCPPVVLAVWSGAVLHFACTGFSDIVASALRLCYLVCKRSVGEGEQKPCDE